jgi:beta-lactamase regulating signal transducer with metallopeptidase domain
LVAAAILRWLPAKRPEARYVVALGAEFGVLIAWLLTWAVLGYQPSRPSTPALRHQTSAVVVVAPRASESAKVETPGSAASVAMWSRHAEWVPILAGGWLIGVALMLIRTSASALGAWRLTRCPDVDDRTILDAVARLRRELGIGRAVRVVASGPCTSPAVLGMVWPTLVLPISVMTGLPPDALRAILAHELAHIRRYDYAFNLAQMFVESLLFFNPAVWWLGRQGLP